MKEVPVEFVEPTRPDKSDKVLVLSGPHKGQLGSVKAIDGNDGIVKINEGTDIKIFSLRHLARYVGN